MVLSSSFWLQIMSKEHSVGTAMLKISESPPKHCGLSRRLSIEANLEKPKLVLTCANARSGKAT